MIYLGKIQTLKVAKTTDNGVYLYSDISPQSSKEAASDSSILDIERILLPKNQVPAQTQLNDSIEVFVYKDSEDRPIATTKIPSLTLGQIAKLPVKEVTSIGAFLDWGLAKDLLLPFKEQTNRPAAGDKVLVSLYIDKSTRLCATMKLYNYLSTDSPYQREDEVSGTVYDIISNFGAYVAVDDKYCAMIPKKELFQDVKIGETIHARVVLVHEDGKLNLSIRKKSYLQMDTDAEQILEALKNTKEKCLPYHDKTDPETIKNVFHMSKNSFKRALGRLMKERQVIIYENRIELIEKSIEEK